MIMFNDFDYKDWLKGIDSLIREGAVTEDVEEKTISETVQWLCNCPQIRFCWDF